MKVFINNFPNPVRQMQVMINGTWRADSELNLTGFDMQGNYKVLWENAMKKLFLCFLLYDEVILAEEDFSQLIKCIGLKNARILLENKIIKTVYCQNSLALTSLNKSGSSLKINQDMMAIPLLYYMEKNFKVYTANKNEQEKNVFLQLFENSMLYGVKEKVDTDTTDRVYDVAFLELKKDLNNNNLKQDLDLDIEDLENMNPYQATKALRVINTIRGLVISQDLSANTCLQDAFTKDYLFAKYHPVLNTTKTDKLDLFSDVLNIKGVVDIFYLFKIGAIRINDIVEIRSKYSRIAFRNWFMSNELTEQEIFRKLMSHKPINFKASAVKHCAISLLGINFSLEAFLLSTSLILKESLSSRLSPDNQLNIFLDETLKESLDKKLKKHNLAEERAVIVRRFGSVGRNDDCPCQSGKKFKKCHGQFK
jgi:hypothetical protein